jgi:hypothetical protein
MPRPDLTVLAIPAFIGAMGAELLWQRRNPSPPGTSRAGDYELADTIASLTMGVGSLVAPVVTKRLLDPVTPGVGRHATPLSAAASPEARPSPPWRRPRSPSRPHGRRRRAARGCSR